MDTFHVYRRGRGHEKEVHVFEGPRWLVSWYCEVGALRGKFFFALKENGPSGERVVKFVCDIRKLSSAKQRAERELFEHALVQSQENYFSLAL